MLNKRLLSTISALTITATMFMGCQTTTPTPEAKFSGVKTIELAYSETSKDMVVAEVTFENGVPKDVNIDVKLEDGTMKSKLSADGGYIMDPNAQYLWHEQIDLIENTIKENNFDLSKITLTDEAGHTDAISGVSMKISSYLNTVQKALDEVK